MAKTEEQKKIDAVIKKLAAVGISADASSVTDVGPLTGKETLEELEAILEKVSPAPAKKDSKTSTTFTFKNGGTRTFSDTDHGKDWKKLSEEFLTTNKATIALQDGEVVA